MQPAKWQSIYGHGKVPARVTQFQGTSIPIRILFFLDSRHVAQQAFIDKFWRRIVQNKAVWHALYCRDSFPRPCSKECCVWVTMHGSSRATKCLYHYGLRNPIEFEQIASRITAIPGRSRKEILDSYQKWRQRVVITFPDEEAQTNESLTATPWDYPGPTATPWDYKMPNAKARRNPWMSKVPRKSFDGRWFFKKPVLPTVFPDLFEKDDNESLRAIPSQDCKAPCAKVTVDQRMARVARKYTSAIEPTRWTEEAKRWTSVLSARRSRPK